MKTEGPTDTAQTGAGDAETAAGEVTPPRRSKVPDVYRKGHTRLTPPCKKDCGDPSHFQEDVSADGDSANSEITIYTESEGGTPHQLWSPSIKVGCSEALKRWEEHKQKKRGEVPKLRTGGSGPSS